MPAENSDHEALAQAAEAAQKESMLSGLTDELERRRARVQELRGIMDSQATEIDMMKVGIS